MTSSTKSLADKAAYKIITERSESLAKNESVVSYCEYLLKTGATDDQVKEYVYKLAIASLYGNGYEEVATVKNRQPAVVV